MCVVCFYRDPAEHGANQLKMQSSRRSPGKLMGKAAGLFSTPPVPVIRERYRRGLSQGSFPGLGFSIQEKTRSPRERKIKYEGHLDQNLVAGAMRSPCLGAPETPNQASKQASPRAQAFAVASCFPSAVGKTIRPKKK